MINAIRDMENITYYGPRDPGKKAGVVAFTVKGMHANDVAYFLSNKNIAIRSGHHCAMPLHKRLNVTGTARASFYVYNEKADIDTLLDALGKLNYR
jgi:cysteine desulfurase/selenocysteine lyase